MGSKLSRFVTTTALLVLASGCQPDAVSVANQSSPTGAGAETRSTTQSVSQGSITDLGTLGGTNSGANAVNSAGDIVGYADLAGTGTDPRAFVWHNGVMTNLGTLGVDANGTSESSYAQGVNDAGAVAGFSSTPLSRRAHAVVWSNGLMVDLGTSGSLGVDSYSYAYAINNAGDVVGFGDVAGGAEHALLWQGGQIIDLGTLGGSGSQAKAINNQGQIVGYSKTAGDVASHAVLWQSGAVADLGTLGGLESFAYGINDAGQVVGSSLTTSGETHAFRWDASSGMTDMGTLAGQSMSAALGINAAGQIVGQSSGSGAAAVAVVWSDSTATGLGNLANALNSEARAVNALGVAVGMSTLASGEAHATVWDYNVSPAASPGGPYAGSEGVSVVFAGAGSTDPDLDPLTFDWDFGDASPHASGAAPTHAYMNDGSYTVTLVVSDGSLTDSASTTASISNALPIPDAGADQSITANVATAFVPSFSDPGVLDAPWTYGVTWGDSSATGTLSTNAQGPQSPLAHTYLLPGSYVRRLTVTDKDGGTAFDNATITVTPTPTLPNVLVLVLDDARFDMVDRQTMPTLFAQVADSGVVFTRGYVNTALCCPSRATMMSGLYQHRTKVLNNSASSGIKKFNDAATVFTALHTAGYVTGNFGKFLNAVLDRYGKTLVPPGIDEWRTTAQISYFNFGQIERPFTGGPPTWVTYGSALSDYQPYVIAREFDQFLTSIPTNKPFLAFLNPASPHSPSLPDPQDAGKCAWRPPIRGGAYNELDVSDQPQQVKLMNGGLQGSPTLQAATDLAVTHTCETLVSADRMIDSVMTSLRRSGRSANTYVFLISDNGFHFGEHRMFDRKATLYEEAVHVPLMVRGPSIVPRIDSQHFVQMADITPTALAIAGIPNALFMNGTSLLPILANAGLTGAKDVLLEGLVPSPSYENASGIRNAGWTYMEFKNGDRALYDMVNDPFQATNLAAVPAYASQKATLAARLKVLKAK